MINLFSIFSKLFSKKVVITANICKKNEKEKFCNNFFNGKSGHTDIII